MVKYVQFTERVLQTVKDALGPNLGWISTRSSFDVEQCPCSDSIPSLLSTTAPSFASDVTELTSEGYQKLKQTLLKNDTEKEEGGSENV